MLDQGQTQLLKTAGMPIGMFPDAEYHCAAQQLPAGSTLYLFSDGAYEVEARDGTQWTWEEFLESLTTAAGLDQFPHAAQTLAGREHLSDDLSLLRLTFSE